jgi:hypothetical protein
VIDGFGVHAADEAQLIGHFGFPGQELAHPHAAIAVLSEFVFRWCDGKAGLSAGHSREALAHADAVGQILVEPFLHHGLVVEEIHLRWAAHHVQIDHVLGFAGKMLEAFARGLLRGFSTRGELTVAEKRAEGSPAEGVRALLKEVAAGDVGFQCMERMHEWQSLIENFIEIHQLVGEHRPGGEQ